MVLDKNNFLKIFNEINYPCYDNGQNFIELKKIFNIKNLLKDYNSEDGDLFVFFYKSKNNKIILSSHIDCVYDKTHCKVKKNGLYATLDNSLTNAILIYCVKKYPKLFSNVDILFTGNEEDKSKGAMEFAQRLNNTHFVLNMDVTCGDSPKPKFENAISKLNDKFLYYLKKDKSKFLVDYSFSDDDYREFSKKTSSAISYCIPILPITKSENWMHDDDGQFVDFNSIKNYIKVLLATIKYIKKI